MFRVGQKGHDGFRIYWVALIGNVAVMPLWAVGIAKADMPPILAVYMLMLFSFWTLGVFWFLERRAKSATKATQRERA